MQTFFNGLVLLIEFVGVGTVIALMKDFVKMRKEQKAEADQRASELELIKEGNRCQLRSEMLNIYYDCVKAETIRQYQLENFITLYKAYKALGGNSFIDIIHAEVKTFKIVT
jgi:hypothetical protein